MARAPVIPDRAAAIDSLEKHWQAILNTDGGGVPAGITALVNSDQTSIRFCILTQMLGKLTDATLDVLCLQRGDGLAGMWDPRGFATRVVVPWNARNQHVLGKSGDPYVSNPLRRRRIDTDLSQMSDRDQWMALCDLLRGVQQRNDLAYTAQIFDQILTAIRARLRALTFTYIVPPRISLKQAERLVGAFLAQGSGGDRGLSVVAALFEMLKEKLGIYTEIRRGMINASDASTNAAGDIECIDGSGAIVLAVEVKEKLIDETDVQSAISKARANSVRELLLCTKGISPARQDTVLTVMDNSWASGTNVYHATIGELMAGILPIIGEAGIIAFITHIGAQLDSFNTQPRHRQAWKAELDMLGV